MFVNELLNSVIFSLLEIENTKNINKIISGTGIKVIKEIF